MIQTTTLRMRVSLPTGAPAEGALVTARLSSVGVNPTSGYVDRTLVEAVAGADGIAALALWPSAVGTSDAQYRIVARAADGTKLLDELVTVPASEVDVWLHDIVLLPAPSKKPYDEAAIAAIQGNLILSQDARLGAETARDAATDAGLSAEAFAVNVAEEAVALQTIRVEAHASAAAATTSATQAAAARDAAVLAAAAAATSEGKVAADARKATDSMAGARALYGDLAAIDYAATRALADADRAEAKADVAAASAAMARADADLASTRAAGANTSALGAAASAATAAAAQTTVATDAANAVSARIRAVAAAADADLDRQAAQVARFAAEAALAAAQRAAADLVSATQGIKDATEAYGTQLVADTTAIKNTAVVEVTAIKNAAVADTAALKGAAVAAKEGAEALYGDLAAVDEAVQISYANRAMVDIAVSNNLIILASR